MFRKGSRSTKPTPSCLGGGEEGRKAEGLGAGVLGAPTPRQALKWAGSVLQIRRGQTWRPLRTSGLEAHVPGTAIHRTLGPGRACSDMVRANNSVASRADGQQDKRHEP